MIGLVARDRKGSSTGKFGSAIDVSEECSLFGWSLYLTSFADSSWSIRCGFLLEIGLTSIDLWCGSCCPAWPSRSSIPILIRGARKPESTTRLAASSDGLLSSFASQKLSSVWSLSVTQETSLIILPHCTFQSLGCSGSFSVWSITSSCASSLPILESIRKNTTLLWKIPRKSHRRSRLRKLNPIKPRPRKLNPAKSKLTRQKRRRLNDDLTSINLQRRSSVYSLLIHFLSKLRLCSVFLFVVQSKATILNLEKCSIIFPFLIIMCGWDQTSIHVQHLNRILIFLADYSWYITKTWEGGMVDI